MSLVLENSNTLLIEDQLQVQAERLLKGQKSRSIATIQIVNDDGSVVKLPANLSSFIRNVLEGLSRGPLSVTALPEELTTNMAAEILGVSRPTLMKWVKDGSIPTHSVGTHTRLNTSDVLAFRNKRISSRAKALKQLLELDD